MNTVTASAALAQLDRLIDETNAAHEPILIAGERNNAVLVSEEDWNAVQETLYLLSVPGMRESIHQGINTPVEECDRSIEW
jgi:PHD/YefM family antitoxin component YafN of YafNO toxin-antitoxin module